jgi:hypothetical protein
MSEQILTASITSDGRYTITVTPSEFREICYSLDVLRKKREAARVCQRKKYEQQQKEKEREKEKLNEHTTDVNYRREYRKALNLVLLDPVTGKSPSPPRSPPSTASPDTSGDSS